MKQTVLNPAHWRSRTHAAWALVAGVLLALAGCNSSSDDESSEPRQAAIQSTASGGYEVLVWHDGETTRRFPASSYLSASLPMEQFDSAARTVSTEGYGRFFYFTDAGVSMIDLHHEKPAQASLLEGTSEVCPTTIASIETLDTQGQAALMSIALRGSDQSCSATPNAMLQVNADATVLLTPLQNERLIQTLKAPDGQVAGLLMAVSVPGGGEWAAWRALGSSAPATLLGVAPTSVSSAMEWLGQDPSQAGLGYLKLNGQLRSLRWSGEQPSLDAAALHTFESSHTIASTSDVQGVYFTDGLSLLHASGATVNTLATLGNETADLSVENLVLTTQRVAAMLSTPNQTDCVGCADYTRLVQSVSRSGGAVATLWSTQVSTGACLGCETMSLGWGAGDQVLLKNCGYNTTSNASYCHLAALNDAQESSSATVDTSRVILMPVLPSSAVQGVRGRQPLGFVAHDMAAQTMIQINLPGLESLTLGSLARASWFDNQTSCTQAVSQMSTTCAIPLDAFGTNQAQEAWAFTPGLANSLRQITAP